MHQAGQSGQTPLFVKSSRVNFLDTLRTGPYLYPTLLEFLDSDPVHMQSVLNNHYFGRGIITLVTMFQLRSMTIQ